MKTGAVAIVAALLLAAWPAWAADWNVDYAKSRLGFTVQWSNEPFSAVFRRWTADIDFDPNDIAHAHAAVTVDLASETSDEPDFDSGLKGAEGFHTSQFPAARFVTAAFVRKSVNEFESRGTLTIRGITRDITLPFTLSVEGRMTHMTGTAHILRTDFGVGQGEWTAATPVSHDVSITVDLYATR